MQHCKDEIAGQNLTIGIQQHALLKRYSIGTQQLLLANEILVRRLVDEIVEQERGAQSRMLVPGG